MPALQVRDFPTELYEELRERARKEHRSIAQQTVVAIREHLGKGRRAEPKESDEEIQARMRKREEAFARIDALPPLVVPEGFPSDVEIIREMRDSR
ncbi:MAG TPA: hypothetical protein DEB24_04405 [Coriobacteriia bacterium]|nr:hypothetical protein [Coriobacteriia bacterium]